MKTKEELKAYYAKWYQDNKENIRERKREADRRYHDKHRKLVQERDREKYKKYYADNPGKYITKTYLRRNRLKQAIPIWANKKKIYEFYKNCPVGLTVDHIIPLNGENVCGLHVEGNLQYLTRENNAKKGNRFKVLP